MVEYFLAHMRAVPITEPVARTHSELWAQLAQKGTPVGAHDLWIAATAVAGGFGVMTNDSAAFGRIPGLRVLSVDF